MSDAGLFPGIMDAVASCACGNTFSVQKSVRWPEEEYSAFLVYVLDAILGWERAELETIGKMLEAYGTDDMHEQWKKHVLEGDDSE